MPLQMPYCNHSLQCLFPLPAAAKPDHIIVHTFLSSPAVPGGGHNNRRPPCSAPSLQLLAMYLFTQRTMNGLRFRKNHIDGCLGFNIDRIISGRMIWSSDHGALICEVQPLFSVSQGDRVWSQSTSPSENHRARGGEGREGREGRGARR